MVAGIAESSHHDSHYEEEEHTRNTTSLLNPQVCLLLQASSIKATLPNSSQTVPSIQIYEPMGPVIIQITTTIKEEIFFG